MSPETIWPMPVISVRTSAGPAAASGARPRRRRPRPAARRPRACGRPPFVTASASRSSSAPGASGTRISTASKCERTSIALMWWTGMSSVAPIAARFLTDGRIDTPPTAAARRRAELRVEDGGDVLELARARRRCRPCRTPRPARRGPPGSAASAPSPRHSPKSMSSARSSDQPPAYGFEQDDGHRDPAERPFELTPAFLVDLLAERHPLADFDRHGSSPLPGLAWT